MISLKNRMVIYTNKPDVGRTPRTTRSEKTPTSIGIWEVSSSVLSLAPGRQIGVNSRAYQSFQVFHLIPGQPKGTYLSTSV